MPGERAAHLSGQGQPQQRPQGKWAAAVTSAARAGSLPLCCHPNITRLTAGHLHCADTKKRFAGILSFPPHSKSITVPIIPISQMIDYSLGM